MASKVELDADKIIEEIKNAIKAQAKMFNGKISDEEIEETAKKDRRKLENLAEETKGMTDEEKEKIISSLKENMTSIDYDKLMEVFSKYSISTLSVDVEDNALLELSKLI